MTRTRTLIGGGFTAMSLLAACGGGGPSEQAGSGGRNSSGATANAGTTASGGRSASAGTNSGGVSGANTSGASSGGFVASGGAPGHAGAGASGAGASSTAGAAATGGVFASGGAAGHNANGFGGAGAGAGASGASLGGMSSGGNAALGGAAGQLVGSGAGAGGANSSTDATLVPDSSWACGLPDGIPPPTQGQLLFSASIKVNDVHDVGVTPFGHRRIIDLGTGTLTGGRLQGTLTNGASDFELTLSNNVLELEEVGVIKATDGTLIYVRGCGVGAPGDSNARVVLDFEVANSNGLASLNTGKFVATRVLDESAGTLTLTAYDVSNVSAGDPKVTLSAPAGASHQPWDCSTQTGSKGSTVFTEQVSIGSSLSVGASKNGTRNVIPITGGTVTGKLTGTVVPGGADYQLLGGTTHFDARYSLASNDGEYVLVRNCGPVGSLIPTFEARADGPYAFLNANTFLSSDPGGGGNGVTITFYDRQ